MCNYFQGITTHNNDSDFVTIDPVEVFTHHQHHEARGRGKRRLCSPTQSISSSAVLSTLPSFLGGGWPATGLRRAADF